MKLLPKKKNKEESFFQKMLCHLRPGHNRESVSVKRTHQVTCLHISHYTPIQHPGTNPEIMESVAVSCMHTHDNHFPYQRDLAFTFGKKEFGKGERG